MRAGHAGMGGVGPSEVRAINVSFQRVALPFDAKAVYLQCYSASLVDQDRMSSGTLGQASSQRLEACPNTVRLGHIDRGNVRRPNKAGLCGGKRFPATATSLHANSADHRGANVCMYLCGTLSTFCAY